MPLVVATCVGFCPLKSPMIPILVALVIVPGSHFLPILPQPERGCKTFCLQQLSHGEDYGDEWRRRGLILRTEPAKVRVYRASPGARPITQ